MEFKVGQYVTLEGAEVIDPRGNFFYTHSYIFFFGIPFKHTGVMTTTHVSDKLDIYAGADTGVNTTFGSEGDPNDSGAFHGGFGLHLLNGNLNILATTHIGPENPDNDEDIRYLNDITEVWKLGDKWTSITDLNYIHDEIAGGQNGWGVAQYFTYAVNDWLSAGIRGEFWRDPEGFFVAAFPENDGFVDFQKGEPAIVLGAGPATYTELTLGLNIKPFSSASNKPLATMMVRPEVRWDHSFDTNAFNDFTDDDQFTIATDVYVVF
ncbi:MAG: outer membrane beta-barrel protein, partial [Chlorobia bacterium]|nr:outer membrane beta-barrel protein [Fimbriimonadaceae bacterium]